MGDRYACASLLTHPSGQLDLLFRVGMEGIDAHDRVDPGLLNRIDVLDDVSHSVLQPAQILLKVFLWDWSTRNNSRRTRIHTMVFQPTNGGRYHRNVRDVP